VGYFDIPYTALGDFRTEKWADHRPEEMFDPSIRIVQRQRLRKNPQTGSLEIVVYVDHTVPKAFHEATKRGVERWSAAFHEMGLGNVVRAVAPGDDEFPNDYDVADVRFNTISWATGNGVSVFAIGQSVADPRSGEILKANIVFTLGWLASWLGEAIFFHSGLDPTAGQLKEAASQRQMAERRLSGHVEDLEKPRKSQNLVWQQQDQMAPLGHSSHGVDPAKLNRARCSSRGRSLRHHHFHEEMACRASFQDSPILWLMLGRRTEHEVQSFLEEGIADVTSHEFGHVLGLRHNFRGSTAVSMTDLQNPEYTAVHGLSSSVMDYLAINIVSNRQSKQASSKLKKPHLFTPVIGAYDKWAIKYGYTQISGESCCTKAPELQKIVEEYQQAEFTFATDEDADRDDPFTTRHDLSESPLDWYLDRLQLVAETQQDLVARSVQPGEGFSRVWDRELRLLMTALSACRNLVRFVGGISMSRRHAHQCGIQDSDCLTSTPKLDGPPPLSVVPAKDQLRALTGVLTFLSSKLGDGALPDPKLQEYLVGKDMKRLVDRAKKIVLDELFDMGRLNNIMLSGRLLESQHLLSDVLMQASEAILGVPKGEDEDIDLSSILRATTSPDAWHTQLEYLAGLAVDVQLELGSWGADHSVAALLLTERQRMKMKLARVATESPSTSSQASFFAIALKLLA